MHPLNGFKGNPFPACELLRPDLTRLRGALVPVPLVEFNPPLGVVAYPFAIVGIGFKPLTLLVSVQVSADGHALALVGKLGICGRIAHATSDELILGFRLGWGW